MHKIQFMKIQILENTEIGLKETENIYQNIRVQKSRNYILVEINNGYGACKSCSCKGWIPNYPKNDYCKNCGHHWTQHS